MALVISEMPSGSFPLFWNDSTLPAFLGRSRLLPFSSNWWFSASFLEILSFFNTGLVFSLDHSNHLAGPNSARGREGGGGGLEQVSKGIL